MKAKNQFNIQKIVIIVLLLFSISIFSQRKNIDVEGIITDEYEMTIPYAAISIEGTSIGTSSTDEGGFNLVLSSSNIESFLVVSSLGFQTAQIKIKDFLALEKKVIVLKESVNLLDDVEVKNAEFYIKEAIKRLKENTISKTHLLKILYRRASIEDGQAKFLVEHYMKVLDRGPSAYTVKKIEVVEGRKSADYRIAKKKQHSHAINYMVKHNPLRNNLSLKEFEWEKAGNSSYDGEEVVIIEGRNGEKNFRRFYIGFDTYKIYKIESSVSSAVFVYKKNVDGKLYLSYHTRAWNQPREIKLPESTRKLMGKNAPESIMVAYRQEVYVVGMETDKDKMKINSFGGFGSDLGDVKVKYNSVFWKNFSIPPDTKFFKKIKKELEENFGVPLEKQFQYSNEIN